MRPFQFWGASVCVRFAFMFGLHDLLLKQLPATKSVVDWWIIGNVSTKVVTGRRRGQKEGVGIFRVNFFEPK